MVTYTRHPGSLATPHAPTRIAARSMPTSGANRQRDRTARTLVPRSRGHQADSDQAPNIGHARTPLTTPLPRAITGFDPLYRPSGRRSALGRSAQWHSLAISRPSHAGACRPSQATIAYRTHDMYACTCICSCTHTTHTYTCPCPCTCTCTCTYMATHATPARPRGATGTQSDTALCADRGALGNQPRPPPENGARYSPSLPRLRYSHVIAMGR